jgi:hypothetical protein
MDRVTVGIGVSLLFPDNEVAENRARNQGGARTEASGQGRGSEARLSGRNKQVTGPGPPPVHVKASCLDHQCW